MARTDIDFKKFGKILKNNNYENTRIKGSHYIFKNAEGNTIVVNLKLNRMVAKRLIKENNLNTLGFAF